jgi:ribonuclease inhibitor barstar
MLEMSAKHVEINGQDIFCEKDFHKLIAEKLDLGPYYGHNADALWDRLSAGAGVGFMLHWADSELSKKRLGGAYTTIVDIMNDARDTDARLGLRDGFDFILE